jgi:hypothetical protein
VQSRALRNNWSKNLIVILGLALPAASAPLQAQVGLSSGVAQVALIARSAPHGRIEGGRTNPGEGFTAVRVSANTGYSLVVRGVEQGTGRIWVQTAKGEFQELKAGSSVTVTHEQNGAQDAERMIQYRVEKHSETAGQLPIRVELRIDPVI